MRLRAPALLAASALALGVLAVPSAQARTTSAAEARDGLTSPDPYYPYGNLGYDVAHYRVKDRYDPDTDKLRGRTRLTATATSTLSTLTLDLVLKVDAVLVDGRRVHYTRPKARKLAITLPRTYAAGSRLTVVVKYHGKPGKIRAYGVAPWVSDGTETVAFGEPEICAWWYACNDHPSDKATYDILVNVPKRDQVLSNGVLVKRHENRRRALVHWRMSQPMASYLAFFAAGRYTVKSYRADGRPVVLAVSRQLAPRYRHKAMAILERTPADVRWLSSQLGPYPFSSTGGVVIGIYVGFALENQSLPVYPYWGGGEAVHSVQVHELAHQWFGDSVSVHQWKDIWLNEGFATYMEWLYTATHGGPSVATQLANQYAKHTSASFWSVKIGDPGTAKLFDDAVYYRGAMTVAALGNVVGASTLAAILRGWVAKYRYSNASIADFVSYAEAVSGKDLTSFFQAWLYTGSKPAPTAANGLG